MTVDSITIIILGIFTVIAGVMFFRMHAFLALLAGGFVIAQLTPQGMILESSVKEKTIEIKLLDENDTAFSSENKTSELKHDLIYWQKIDKNEIFPGYYYSLDKFNDKNLQVKLEITELEFPKPGEKKEKYIKVKQLSNQNKVPKLPAVMNIVSQRDLQKATETSRSLSINRVVEGMGKTFTQIGLMIAMAAILGQCMLISGSAIRIVTTIKNSLGEKYTTFSFVACGFILSIPVYFDTVFYLMLPLAKAMAQQTKKDYLKYIISIVVGGTLAHSLVPPTPGPLLVSEKLQVNFATMFIMGSMVSIIGISVGYLYMNFICRFVFLPIPLLEHGTTDAEEQGQFHSRRKFPPFILAILPVVFPVLAIGLQASWGVIFKEKIRLSNSGATRISR